MSHSTLKKLYVVSNMTPKILLYAIVLLCCSVSYGRADTIITDPGTGIADISPGATVGFDFTVGSSPLLVTSLGLWDENQDGFANSHMVGLWDNSGNLLGSVTISPSTTDPLLGEFRYATLGSPVTLLAGTTYVLGGSYVRLDADHYLGTGQRTFNPAVASGNARFRTGAGFVFPVGNTGNPGSFVGPNAQFTVVGSVPDVGTTFPLFGLSLMGLADRKSVVRERVVFAVCEVGVSV